MATLPTVPIPGYAAAVRRESHLRDTAFLGGHELVCGVEVMPLSLRRLIWLEQAKNGFVVSCVFDDATERLAHALQVLFFCLPDYAPPISPQFKFWQAFRDAASQRAFFVKALKAGTPDQIIAEVQAWLDDAFMDAGQGGGSSGEVMPPSFASYPAHVVDKFAEAGLPFAYDEIMDMPLRRLWQHWRLALRRLHAVALTNPSDTLAVEYLSKVNNGSHRN